MRASCSEKKNLLFINKNVLITCLQTILERKIVDELGIDIISRIYFINLPLYDGSLTGLFLKSRPSRFYLRIRDGDLRKLTSSSSKSRKRKTKPLLGLLAAFFVNINASRQRSLQPDRPLRRHSRCEITQIKPIFILMIFHLKASRFVF